MHGFEETRVLACSSQSMFDVVMDIEAYPDFLPWVAAANVLSDDGSVLTAELTADFAGLKQKFTTEDRYVQGKCIEIRLLDGPFRFLESFWSFEALGEKSCKVHFSIEFDFKSAMLGMVAAPVFTTACKSMVHAFEARACQESA
ncbi:MAG: type II toxin-antitoxin system RatA family toxin [Mariprofundaceae bacterium]